MFRAILIDFDDTLCLAEASGFELENDVLRQMGHAPQSREVHQRTWGQPLFQAVLERAPGVDVAKFLELTHKQWLVWARAGKHDVISEDNLVALDQLLLDGRELYVVTSRTQDEVAHLIVDDHPLCGRINAFYYHDNMTHHKPDPRAFDVVLQRHGLQRSECIYIGDTPGDAVAAKGADLTFIANLENGLHARDDFVDLGVDMFVDRFSDVPAAIVNLECQQDETPSSYKTKSTTRS